MPGTAVPRGNLTGPTSWPVSYAACTGDPFADDAADQATFEALATTYLWEWTGRKYGTEDTIIRPCRRARQMPTFFMESPYVRAYGMITGTGAGWGGWLPVILPDGSWGNVFCGMCNDGEECSCTFVSTIRIPGPVASVTSVEVDGVVLSPTENYRVDGPRLVRIDGEHWPHCQDMALAAGYPGTWSVEYERGLAVPMGGQVAAGVLAWQLYLAACGNGSCQLPQRVQTITRQGVTMAMLDDFTNSLDKGYTGIWVVDSWIASVMATRQSAIVMSPDFRRPNYRP